ncbi:MAG TPA: phosphopentomutase, partial [Nitrospirota bacterium]
LGVGELPDAAKYYDTGSNTLGNMATALGGLSLPNFERLGLGNIGEFKGINKVPNCQASFGKMNEVSAGKDTITGHWEMMGVQLSQAFPTYPDGFPPEIIDAFKKDAGVGGTLGNKTASGTGILDELGEEHLRTGWPIVYTSADSVFQIAAHIDLFPLPKLYEMCEAARRLLTGKHNMGRVIARPFSGEPGGFARTFDRRDYSCAPPHDTVLDIAKASGLPVVGIGKIGDIFAGRGLTEDNHTKGNADGLRRTLEAMKRINEGIIFTNLVDFDMLYGHRNDAAGYYGALREFDGFLPRLLAAARDEDILIFTGDHGCDPTTPSTEHSREYTPLLVYGKALKGGVDLGTRGAFSDLGATVAEAFGLAASAGKSFLKEIS